ncbi:aminoglycoside 6-adenylyltransferase [Erysipelothrix rhusiopathiae]|uniref:aminoglycoside 6-adenylyltransferase n=1 Tax=Erysipelothrix rhusiopathiae TaxID=1648 RepID=UPI000E037342|nr:aminoglycoside 6-adenylyltransferase [Erysipelothrix rhusiopathiae]MCG4435969.1 aminoglycoside 6-adenylyltransferase [Erysipelothrix rhusiopathiae]MCG4456627.1 aminoglycoside 6-adenylyltransferase [Erysipelothrix rhusiopathiae]MDE8031944.1 aminoglycoside 6-adenylyltransferase [Erysipelothrix rhusiopathiae]MDE8036833.1 aminoglycoside 6-adenylyltransferase [Erysipelothrix rhusiopathiae]MDE8038391.1 aminoglycoside 6-adenylyltransferase [Erysipelothrix rhusiopathiae]
MRTETEIMTLILEQAKLSQHIRIVAMNGSRVNKEIEKDSMQDYDIAFIVDNLEYFINHQSWLEPFGKVLMMQRPDDFTLFGQSKSRDYHYLVQFEDGVRIDFTFIAIENLEAYLQEDHLVEIILDKDSIISGVIPATDRDYWIKKPNEQNYRDCINEMLWLSFYVVKGIKRHEPIYAMDHLASMRQMLLQMITWQVGFETDFSISVGKNYKYLDRYISSSMWDKLLATYNLSSKEQCVVVLESMLTIFSVVADRVGDYGTFVYDRHEYHDVSTYVLKQINDE